MQQITLKIDGMMCGMCESHINESIRNNFSVKKVTSSHTKGETVILTENDLDEAKLKEIIDKTGYKLLSVSKAPTTISPVIRTMHILPSYDLPLLCRRLYQDLR